MSKKKKSVLQQKSKFLNQNMAVKISTIMVTEKFTYTTQWL